MPSPLFMLAVYGRHGDLQAKLSAYDMERGLKALLEAINAELGGLTREGTGQMVRAAADTILRRHGLVGPNTGGGRIRSYHAYLTRVIVSEPVSYTVNPFSSPVCWRPVRIRPLVASYHPLSDSLTFWPSDRSTTDASSPSR